MLCACQELKQKHKLKLFAAKLLPELQAVNPDVCNLEIEGSVGSGGFGTAYKATAAMTNHTELPLIVKISEDLDRAQAEVANLQSLHAQSRSQLGEDSAHVILPVSGYIEIEDEVEGSQLGCFFQERGDYDVRTCADKQLRIFEDPKATAAERVHAEAGLTQLIQGTAECCDHLRQVLFLLHGDLKPQNFVVWTRPDGRTIVKVIDLAGSLLVSLAITGPDGSVSWDKDLHADKVLSTIWTRPPSELVKKSPGLTLRWDAWGKAMTILLIVRFLKSHKVRARFASTMRRLICVATKAPSFEMFWSQLFFRLKMGVCKEHSEEFCKVASYHAAMGIAEAVGRKDVTQLSALKIQKAELTAVR
eukprot:scaffold115850_cov41-Prasinocladus_malaysianus.AAC.1